MQGSQPVDLSNLQAIFKKHDNDNDGYVNDIQIDQIFKQVGYTNIYIGTIKKVIRLMNTSITLEEKLNFNQLQQFANAFITQGKSKIWKAKYSTKNYVHNLAKQLYGNQQQGNAAPGAGPGAPVASNKNQLNSQQGQINLNIGQANYNQHIEVTLSKQKGQQIKPFIKITIQRETNEQALKIQTLFKKLYDTLIQIIKAQQQQLINQIMSISFITSVNNNIFSLFITTNNKDLIQLIQLYGQTINMILKQQISAKIQAKYKINFDFNKFINEENYNFYDMIVKNCQISIKWNIWDLFKNLRKICLNAMFFEKLQYGVEFPQIFMIALLHCERFTGSLQFQNTSTQNQQIISKIEIVKLVELLRKNIQQFSQGAGLDILGLIKQIDGNIKLQASLKDWKFNLNLKLNGLTKILTEDIKVGQQNDDY